MISLLYHDVVPAGAFASSGFCSPDANIYKISVPEFSEHLTAIQNRGATAVRVFTEPAEAVDGALLFTFDDGGSSSLEHTAGILEARGWRGYFFVTTDYIGQPGFMKADDIRELRRRGHVIGSHSCSHPARLSHCSAQQIEREWTESVRVLSEILSEPVTTGSVPGGFYSHEVRSAAEKAGIRVLFNSEPVSSATKAERSLVIGRYSIQQGFSGVKAASIAHGDFAPRLSQYIYWNAKKVAKRFGGETWLKFRKSVLAAKNGPDGV